MLEESAEYASEEELPHAHERVPNNKKGKHVHVRIERYIDNEPNERDRENGLSDKTSDNGKKKTACRSQMADHICDEEREKRIKEELVADGPRRGVPKVLDPNERDEWLQKRQIRKPRYTDGIRREVDTKRGWGLKRARVRAEQINHDRCNEDQCNEMHRIHTGKARAGETPEAVVRHLPIEPTAIVVIQNEATENKKSVTAF